MTEQETKRYNAMLEVIKQIDRLVHVPSIGKNAITHYSNDFERIRKLTAPWHDK